MKKKIIIQLISIIALAAILTVLVINVIKLTNQNAQTTETRRPEMMGGPGEESTEKDTEAEDVESGQEVTESNINLSKYDTNITITKEGEYTLTGIFENCVLINTNGAVTLNLNGVTIENETTAVIANIGTGELVINIVDGTENKLSDGGSSEYDACIYSVGKLTITGNGKLSVYGNQTEGEGIATETNDITINSGNIYIESNDDGINAGGDGGTITINDGEIYIKANGDGIDSNQNLIINGGTIYAMGSAQGGDSGIDTDDGFEINGGTIIALGSDMLETPEKTSTQNTICFTLDETISEGTNIALLDENDNVTISFKANETFKTLIISSEKLTNGTYKLYKNGINTGTLTNGLYAEGNYTKGTEISVSNNTEFIINSTITTIGTTGRQ